MARMQAEDRRRQLVAVAAEQFARSGYRGTTTTDVVESAGVTPPILYRHFESKLDLFVATVEETGRQIAASWETRLGQAGGTAATRRRIALAFADEPDRSNRYRLIAHAMNEAENEPVIGSVVRQALDRAEAALIRSLPRAQAREVLEQLWGKSALNQVPAI